MSDYKNKRAALDAELQVGNFEEKIAKLETENQNLKQEVAQLNNEMSVVDWYMEIMEAGQNAKKIIDLFQKEKSKFQILDKQQKSTISHL